ncbi:hypothetical protein SUGI_1173140 [Cryptomeria japonica]|uniref:uncharacterized protein LOC131068267 n=1 Tax=Cryptomeria japonica TaxID=3369 RepID=UPI002414789E|nr:uncharacterized protein LOC131068267 [Cryptomeria japonica]GLJ54608.1 hypothetical protein SUGI_1173140 [Cryptomeria japonica]
MFRIIYGGMLSERVMAPQCSVDRCDALCPASAPTLLQRNVGGKILAETAIKIICWTGGVVALAHPWVLNNPVSVVRNLKEAGFHGIEIYTPHGKADDHILASLSITQQ